MIITIEDIKADQKRLADKIVAFERAKMHAIDVAHTVISLAAGEVYAGLILNEDGVPLHHLVLLPGEYEGGWYEALAWTAQSSGELPIHREQLLLSANAGAEFRPGYYWSAEERIDGSTVWIYHFGNGGRGRGGVNKKFLARAIRRVPV